MPILAERKRAKVRRQMPMVSQNLSSADAGSTASVLAFWEEDMMVHTVIPRVIITIERYLVNE